MRRQPKAGDRLWACCRGVCDMFAVWLWYHGALTVVSSWYQGTHRIKAVTSRYRGAAVVHPGPCCRSMWHVYCVKQVDALSVPPVHPGPVKACTFRWTLGRIVHGSTHRGFAEYALQTVNAVVAEAHSTRPQTPVPCAARCICTTPLNMQSSACSLAAHRSCCVVCLRSRMKTPQCTL